MDEKVLHDYLETVEISLFKQVRARSDQFFQALAAFHNLRKGVADACGAITSLRDAHGPATRCRVMDANANYVVCNSNCKLLQFFKAPTTGLKDVGTVCHHRFVILSVSFEGARDVHQFALETIGDRSMLWSTFAIKAAPENAPKVWGLLCLNRGYLEFAHAEYNNVIFQGFVNAHKGR